ncbi:NAD(P)/FAD-dependent oxidoreductase [Sphingorhabdus contaminans]|uniref:N-acyl homoserine lactone synthase n=1 Tax=Sphingorhabdus contaminans TaxID=1343899 RepID=A0A553WCB1_9SPHN|nr:FAD-dependent oxidoreductase [Sphingorhabdus contaminans]TSB02327.1 N-acyl homoserine lactone synthase [Sphingorhabdus contaminans]
MGSKEDFRVAIVGGGYAGFSLARMLDNHVDVTLIEAREAFVMTPATLRAVVEPDLLDEIVIPYDRLLNRGRVVHGRVVSIDPGGITLADDARIQADAIVVATGSRYAAPFKPQDDNIPSFKHTLISTAKQIAQSDSVVIVGSGAAGVELAGEIKVAFPGKKVTLVGDQSRLFPMYTEKLHKELTQRFNALGVTVSLNSPVRNLKQTSAPFTGQITLANGSVLSGLIIPTIGAHAADSPAHELPGVRCEPNGQLSVDSWLRPSRLPNVFVLGDLAATGDGMTIVAIGKHVPWMKRALLKLAAGQRVESLQPYKGWRIPPILVPLGPKLGVSVVPLGKEGMTVGDWFTSKIKGKNHFIPRYHKEFNR